MTKDTEDVRPDWVEEATRLTRIALSGNDEARDERDEIAADHGYVARERDDDGARVLVLHPDDWLEDGVVDLDAFDADEAYEIPLEGRGYEEAREANASLLSEFSADADEADTFNARSFAEFCESHHSVAVENATVEQVEEFVNDYYVRNVWAPDESEERLEESLRRLFEYVGREDLKDVPYQATK